MCQNISSILENNTSNRTNDMRKFFSHLRISKILYLCLSIKNLFYLFKMTRNTVLYFI